MIGSIVTNSIFLIALAVTFGIGAMLALVNLVVGILQRENFPDAATCRKNLGGRAILFAMLLVLTLAFTACSAGSAATKDGIPEDGNEPAVSDTATEPGTQPEDETPPAPEPEEFEPEALEYVSMTQRQMSDFLEINGFSIKLDKSSLNGKKRDRIEATGKYGDPVEGALDFPWVEVMEKLSDLKAGKITSPELDSWLKDVRHTLYQKIIANPVIGDAWAQLLAESELVTRNNQWLLDFLEKLDELYSIQQDREISNEDILGNQSLDTIPAGLDYLVVETSGGELTVNEWYKYNAVRLCFLLDNFSFTGEIVSKTSVRNMANNLAAEDSYVRAMFSPVQENEPALRLVHRQKALDGKSQVVLEYGLNPRDGRPEEFNPKEIPVKETPKETSPKKPTPEPQLPKDVFVDLTFEHREIGTERILRDNATKKNQKAGGSCEYYAPTIDGFICLSPIYRVDPVPSSNKTYVIYYQKEAPKTHVLTINYVNGETGELMSGVSPNPYVEQLEKGASRGIKSQDIPGWVPDKAVVNVVMGDSDITETVVYTREVYEIVVEHRNAVTGEKMPGMKDHVEDVPYEGEFLYIAPAKEGWTWEPAYVSIDKVTGDGLYTIWYTPITREQPKKDGEGFKDPSADPAPQGNAPIGGGPNKPTDGTGEFEPEEPPLNDGIAGSYESTPAPDEEQETPVVIGTGDNVTPPATEEIPVDTGTTVTYPETSDEEINTSETKPTGGFLPMP